MAQVVTIARSLDDEVLTLARSLTRSVLLAQERGPRGEQGTFGVINGLTFVGNPSSAVGQPTSMTVAQAMNQLGFVPGVFSMQAPGGLILDGSGLNYAPAALSISDTVHFKFGFPFFQVVSSGNTNAIVGSAVGSSAGVFPTGVTGYAEMRYPGSSGTGMHGRLDSGVVGCGSALELNTFNHSGTQTTSGYEPTRALSAPDSQLVGLTIAPGCAAGAYVGGVAARSLIGIHILPEGSTDFIQTTGTFCQYDYGLVFHRRGIYGTAIVVDADTVYGPGIGVQIATKNGASNRALRFLINGNGDTEPFLDSFFGGTARVQWRPKGSLRIGYHYDGQATPVQMGEEYSARLTVYGSDTVRGVTNVAAAFGLDYSVVTDGSVLPGTHTGLVAIGNLNGTLPFIGALKTYTGSVAQSLGFVTGDLVRFKVNKDGGVVFTTESVTPTLTDGLMWFDGTNWNGRVGGVTKTFTIT